MNILGKKKFKRLILLAKEKRKAEFKLFIDKYPVKNVTIL